jgi:hypothetical protein
MLEQLSRAKKLDEAKKLFSGAQGSDTNWQSEAITMFNFRDGNQWTSEERAVLEAEMRPVLTFNLTKSQVDLVMGMNEDNRVKYRATPVEPSDAYLAEVLNNLVDWVNEQHEFEAEEDGALESATICGRGYVGIDFGPDPKKFGDIILSEVDIPVHEVHFDPSSRRPHLQDAGYIFWDRWINRETFKMRYPKVSKARIDAMMESGRTIDSSIDMALPGSEEIFDDLFAADSDLSSDYDTPLDINYYHREKNLIRVIHMEYWENFKRYFVFNPEEGEFVEVDKNPTKQMKAEFRAEFGEDMTVEFMIDKRVRWFQFTGDDVLFDDVSPLPYAGFSIVPMFAFRDVSKRTPNHFGIVKLMVDPQKEINKRWSQALNMLNQQVQPGIYAETDAFVDEAQAEQSMKEAGAITWVNSGALTSGRIKERTVPTFPNAPMQMEEYSKQIIKQVTGINPDLMGEDRGRREPGVVVKMRQQQGLTLLKPLFKNYNAMKKRLFKRQVAILMKYMPTRQMLQVLGQGDRYQIDRQSGAITDTVTGMSANIRDVQNMRYNINAEETKGNMAKRMLELSILMEIGQGGQIPVDPMQIIEKLDLPATEKLRWVEYIKQQMEQQTQIQTMAAEFEMNKAKKELDLKEQDMTLDFVVDMAKIQQMQDKDDKSMAKDFAKMDAEERANLMNYVAQMASVAAQVSAAEASAKAVKEGKSNESKTSASKK